MIRLRQIAFVAADLARAEAEVGGLLGESVCFRDPGVGHFGLHNALFAVGERFLEIVSPTQPGTTAGRLLDKRGGDGGYMVILQTDDLEPLRARSDDLGVRLVFEAEGDGIVGLHFHPRDLGGAILSVDQSDDWNAWPWAGSQWPERARSADVTDLVGVELQAEDPAALATRWAEFLGHQTDGNRITLDDGSFIRFVAAEDGRGDGVGGVTLAGPPERRGETVLNSGVRIEFV